MPVKNSKNSSFKSEPIGTLENDCDKMYGMGSSYELNEEECEYAFLACKIIEENDSEIKEEMKNWYKTKEKIDVVSYKKEIENKGGDIESIINKFTRPDGGYIKQLKRYLNIDLNDFDYSYIRNKRERAKVLYFLY
ncbi:MAG TPA: hypothetical protein DDX91_06980, partial [Ruminococcaceae bacterium]|nr:hypothetical protein [Oscillospiraceae bacterium]